MQRFRHSRHRRLRADRGLDRGTVCRACRAPAARPDPQARPEQRDLRPTQAGARHRRRRLRTEPLQPRPSRR